MPPLRAVRRLVMAPLVVAIAAALTVLTPPLALLSAAFNLVRQGSGRVDRMRTLRVACFALVWFVGETAALTVLLCLWIASGFGGRLDTEPYQSRHYAVMRWLLGLIYRTAQRTCGLRVEAAGPKAPENRPLIVLSRHAGPGDSLLLVHHLLSACDRRPRMVMKATLQLDPSLDVMANRLPNAFVGRRRAGARSHTEQIRRLAAGLDGRGALLLFPEGRNWTPLRWRRAIARLHRQDRDDLAERAAAMPSVLPPRGGGALAAIAACPTADVIFVAHTGLDRLVSARDVWHSLSADIHVRARWWRVPAGEVPRGTDHETQVRWLYDWWRRIDAWITSQQAGQRLPPRYTSDAYTERTRLTVDGPRLPGQVADRLDVVAVRVAHVGAVVVLVVLRPHPRLVQNLGAETAGRFEERPDGVTAGRGEGEVRLAEAFPGVLRSDPEVRALRRSVADRHAEVHDPLPAERRKHRVVERRARRHVGALDTHMIKHGPILAARTRGVSGRSRCACRWWRGRRAR
jgi:1-acyl-sn-glycerol-3-phosphate acyltransferase